ncbi:MAG: putative secreted protein with C-terminal beta-propeller domain [Cognaticolwellia sp.]|jgi:uncharacterized secreted protein with C-terminal beta-propeller domain
MPTLLVTLALTGCNLRDPQVDLKSFKSCEDLEATLKDQAIEEIRWAHSWGGGGIGFGRDYAMTTESDSANMGGQEAPMSDGAGGDRSYSDTNTQVLGVDEADLMETDGTHIYVLAGDHLMVTKAWPAEDASVQSRLPLEGRALGMYLREDAGELVVLTEPSYQQPQPLSGGSSDRVVGEGTQVKTTIIDISDATAPTVLREVYTQGSLQDSRIVGDTLYVVSYADLGTSRYMWEYDNKEKGIRAVKASVLADWLPGRFDNLRSGDGWAVGDSDVSDCERVFYSDRASGNFMVNVESLDLTDLSSGFQGTSVLTSVDAVYANANNLYVVGSEASDGPWQSYDNRIETIVHRFDISGGQAAPDYMGSGKVPGWVLNQFSLDEHNGHLRVATTSQGEGDTSTGLYVLDDSMDMVGQVTDLAPGEQIYSVRFEGDDGYVVTFEQVDPLFTFDLSDPKDPQLMGELKITGFSNYMHPMGDGHLLAVGMEATDDGWATNLSVSIFDVSDLSDPTLASRLQIEDAYGSEAQYEHLAFNYYAPEGVLLMPANTDSSTGSELLLIQAESDQELAELGRINQDSLVDAMEQDTWCSGFRRSVVIENYAYAISNAGISIANLDDEQPESMNQVAFTGVDACAGEYFYW